MHTYLLLLLYCIIVFKYTYSIPYAGGNKSPYRWFNLVKPGYYFILAG